jgi:hypothetical protein
VHLVARFRDVSTGTKNNFAVTGSETDLSLRHDGVLVLPGVQVGSYRSLQQGRDVPLSRLRRQYSVPHSLKS